jgi:hypothetical protein
LYNDLTFTFSFHLDDDFGLDDPLEEKEEEEEEVVDLPMEMPEDKTAELKEIMLKYAKLQKELEDEKQRRDEEIAKRDEEMKDMAKAIEVLQSSMSEAAIDGDDQTLISSTSNSVHKPVTSSSIGKPTLNGYSLENSASYNNPDTPYDGIVRNSKRTYCESPLEDTSDCKSEDGQDPNYNSPEDDDDDDDKGQDLNYDSPNDEEEEEEEQDLNYDSPNDEEEEVEEKEKGKEEEEEEQDLNYDSPDEEPQPNARYNTMPATSEPKSPINRSNTL